MCAARCVRAQRLSQLAPGTRTAVSLLVPPSALLHATAGGQRVVAAGTYTLSAGDGQLKAQFSVTP